MGHDKLYLWKCVKCGNIFEDYLNSHRCLKCYPILSGTSLLEKEVVNFCRQFFNDLQIRNRTLIKPYELDIVIPEIKLAIEFNGAYWHSIEAGLPLGYHLMKTELCEAQNYRLIHIWEDEWSNNQNEIKERLKQIFENKEIIDYSKPLDRCWYRKTDDFDIISPNIVERLSFHVENCGFLVPKENK